MSTNPLHDILKNDLFIHGLYPEQRNEIKKLVLKAEIVNNTEMLYKISAQILKIFTDHGITGTSNVWVGCSKCTYNKEIDSNKNTNKCSLVSSCIELEEILQNVPNKSRSAH